MTKTLTSGLVIAAVLAAQVATATSTANAVTTQSNITNAPAQISAADIRILLSRQLSEHALLIATASGAVAEKRGDDAEMAFKSLDENSVDLSKSFGTIYGKDVETRFLSLWREHVESVESYVNAVTAKDKTKSAAAQKELIDYSKELAAFVGDINPNLPKEVVVTLAASLVKEHVVSLKDLIDAQAAGNQTKAFQEIRAAYAHMDMMAKVFADVITKQFPAKYMGAIDSPDVELRVKLNNLLAERTFLAGMTTDALVGKRATEAQASAAALAANTADFAAAVGAIYDKAAKAEFLPKVRHHTNTVVDYANGLITNDKAKSATAFEQMLSSGADVAMFFAMHTPTLKEADVTAAFKVHNQDLKAVVDAQAAHDLTKSLKAIRDAYARVNAIADPLADSLVTQFPNKFGGKATASTASTATTHTHLPVSGGSLTTAPDVSVTPTAIAKSIERNPASSQSLVDRALATYWKQQAQHNSKQAAKTAIPAETPLHIQIPTIGLDAPIVAVGVTKNATEWNVPDFRAAGWLNTSTLLGTPGNLVLSGHHNIQGRVFEHLKDVHLGDQITVAGAHRSVTYIVTTSEVLPEKNQPEFVRAEHAKLIAPTPDDRLTLITCWPPDNNTHRLVVIARKVSEVSDTVAKATAPQPE